MVVRLLQLLPEILLALACCCSPCVGASCRAVYGCFAMLHVGLCGSVWSFCCRRSHGMLLASGEPVLGLAPLHALTMGSWGYVDCHGDTGQRRA